jgi:(E)-4-hydroxy-3-methylbut-2-enyl-diphosphate synthase
MLNVRSDDMQNNVKQAVDLENAGCDIIRVAVPDIKAVQLISEIKNSVSVPLVADIHFDYRIALECIQAGVDKIRINPGNIGDDEHVKEVATACSASGIPIRIGVNSGSVEKNILAKYGSPTADALVESALYHVSLLERYDFNQIVISVKCSNVITMIEAYRKLAEVCPYPLHLGVTEAGTERMGIIKSAVGIGSLLVDGIGETIRVSLTDDPIKEVNAARDILKSIGKYDKGVNIISCPTCGRTKIDLISLTNQIESSLVDCDKKLTVAIMGCVVNGPGEAKDADIGIAGGDGCAVLFKKGEITHRINEDEIVSVLLEEINNM